MSNTTTDRVHGELLREWRESQKLDVSTLATRANLSVAQIKQLESGGTSLFTPHPSRKTRHEKSPACWGEILLN